MMDKIERTLWALAASVARRKNRYSTASIHVCVDQIDGGYRVIFVNRLSNGKDDVEQFVVTNETANDPVLLAEQFGYYMIPGVTDLVARNEPPEGEPPF